jgi:aspartyl-tRNA synthetase
MIRTHTCGQLNSNNVNQEVVLCGWVHARRDHGKLIFIDIRDRYGTTQVVFSPKDNAEVYKIAETLRSEYVIMLKGKVNKRPKGTINPKIPTGEVELIALDLKILNPAELPPFEIDDNAQVTEEVRLEYRYLDLRRPKIMEAMVLRHKLCKLIRDFLDAEGFLEIETPILTKSTPEGARDYLVPSRLNPGAFFALPQSPQLFKQVLMVAGLDKYFQIAKCFRDEDLRADRQPEFTQLDIEMSFINEEDIFDLCERLTQRIFRDIKKIDIKIPFERMSYKEAMQKYNSDKPDLRNNTDEFCLVWVKDFPLFKYNDEEKRWESEHHPFTSPNQSDIEFLEKRELANVRARSYDLVLNGVEIASGSIRIHQQSIQEQIFQIIGLTDKEINERFGFLLRSFKYGAPPHGGIAFGLDRLIALLKGVDSIRDVIAFPKTQKAVCPLTEAPSQVNEKQLKELGISVPKKKEGNYETKNV